MMNRIKMIVVALAFSFNGSAAMAQLKVAQSKIAPSKTAKPKMAPNIIFIMADDLGYGDVHALNPKSKIPTPNLDALAAAGMTFTDAHSPSSVCTPTRYGLLTGRYCWRSKLKRGVLNGYSPPLIESERPTIASFLSKHGYRCGVVGKWHLGLNFAKKGKKINYSQPISGGPLDLGFAFSHIIPASLDMPPYIFLQNSKATDIPRFTQPARKFPAFLRRGPRSGELKMSECLHDLQKEVAFSIEEESAYTETPFFLYFPLTAPHKPVVPHADFRGRTKLGPYGDFVMQVDWVVGEVFKSLRQFEVADNTLVIFTSDNGSFMRRQNGANTPDHVSDETIQAYNASNHTANGPLRGTKADIWEAGHRVPFFRSLARSDQKRIAVRRDHLSSRSFCHRC